MLTKLSLRMWNSIETKQSWNWNLVEIFIHLMHHLDHDWNATRHKRSSERFRQGRWGKLHKVHLDSYKRPHPSDILKENLNYSKLNCRFVSLKLLFHIQLWFERFQFHVSTKGNVIARETYTIGAMAKYKNVQ